MLKSQILDEILIKAQVESGEINLLFPEPLKRQKVRFYIFINSYGCLTDFTIFRFYIFIKLVVNIEISFLLCIFLLNP